MTEFNSPLGRRKMAQQASQPTYTVEDTSDGPGEQPQPQTRSQRKRQRRQAMSQVQQPPGQFQEFQGQSQVQSPMPAMANQAPVPKTEANSEPAWKSEAGLKKRQAALQAMGRLSPAARERLEAITGISRKKGTCEVAGMSFSFQSLKTWEMMEVTDKMFEGGDQSTLSLSYWQRIYTLSQSLTHIDGQPISYVLGTDDLDAVVLVFLEQDEHVTDHLWDWYKNNIEKAAKMDLTPEEIKEVAEDVKKS